MARGDQLSRQWKIIQTLVASTQGKTVSALADRLGCTPRTVYRDLEALQAGGFPITTETRDNRSYWHILNASRQQVPLAFSIPELMALYFGKDMLKTYRGTIFYDAIESLLSKIKATLPTAYIDYLDRIRDRVDAGPAPRKDYTRFGPIIAELNRAIIDEKKIRMVYFSMGRQKESRRTVHPYRLRHVEDTLYLIGYCDLRKGVRTFAVDRIKTVSLTENGFQIPEGFDVPAFLRDSFSIYQGSPVRVKIPSMPITRYRPGAATSEIANASPIDAPMIAIALVRCSSRVRSATNATTAAEMAPAPCRARPAMVQ